MVLQFVVLRFVQINSSFRSCGLRVLVVSSAAVFRELYVTSQKTVAEETGVLGAARNVLQLRSFGRRWASGQISF